MRLFTSVVLVAGLLAMTGAVSPGLAQGAGAEGDRQSYSQAMDWYRKGAEAGDPKAQFYYGLALERGAQGHRDVEAAALWFARAAVGGFALAQYKLGLMLQFGEGIAADPAEARRLYRSAADQGVVEAQYNLAVMLQDGLGGPADTVGAAALFETAARGGVSIGFLHLGVLYAQGEGLEPDVVEALKWVLLAERAEVDGAAEMGATLRRHMTAEQIVEATANSVAWK